MTRFQVAYYECGGAVDVRGPTAPTTCPHDGCDAELEEVVEVMEK